MQLFIAHDSISYYIKINGENIIRPIMQYTILWCINYTRRKCIAQLYSLYVFEKSARDEWMDALTITGTDVMQINRTPDVADVIACVWFCGDDFFYFQKKKKTGARMSRRRGNDSEMQYNLRPLWNQSASHIVCEMKKFNAHTGARGVYTAHHCVENFPCNYAATMCWVLNWHWCVCIDTKLAENK
jgi:hypothetical protein